MASEAPRSLASNSKLSESRKASLQGLNVHAAASSSNESLATPTIMSSPRMATTQTSVLARAKAFDARAHAGRGAATFSPATSPPPMSPFVGARIVIPQSMGRGVTSNGVRSPSTTPQITPTLSGASKDVPEPDKDGTPTPEKEEAIEGDTSARPVAPAAISTESLPTTATRKASLVPTEGGSSEDDRTPRQSTTYTVIPPASTKVSRADSSRQPAYSLKARTYSPELKPEPGPEPEPERKGSGGRAEPPRLPKLYFEGSLTGDGAHPAMPSAKSTRSPYSSPSTEIARAGWSGATEKTKSHRHGQSLTVPGNSHQVPIADSSPPEEYSTHDGTFYWASPNDTDNTDDEADVEDNPGGHPAMPKRTDTNMTSANVFGPGGPSDWEHFYGGDYETEMVDDTDIYLTEKEKDRLKREEQERTKLMAAARRKSEDDAAMAAEITRRFEGMKREEEEEEEEEEGGGGGVESSGAAAAARLRTEPSLPTIEETAQEEPEEENIRRTDVDYEPDIDALDGFARSPPPATPATLQNRSRDTKVDEPLPTVTEKKSQESVKTIERMDTAISDGDAVSKGIAEQQRPDSEIEPEARLLNNVKISPPPEIKMPEPTVESMEDAKSGPSSPPFDDPNAGHITVSMVLPADFNPVSTLDTSATTTSHASKQPPQARVSPPLTTAGARKSVFPQADELPNPYAGLSAMAKASLNRFVRMLREEEKAESDQDKFFVFIAFAQHEMKLRATLYDMDDEEMSLPTSKRASIRSSINKKLGKSQPSLRSKPLPAAPISTSEYDPTLGRNQSFGVSAANRLSMGYIQIPLQSQSTSPPARSAPAPPGETPDKSSKSSDESFVLVDSPEAKIVSNTPAPHSNSTTKSPLEGAKKASLETLNKSIDLIAPRTSMISDPSIAVESVTSSEKTPSERLSGSPLPAAQILNHSLSVKSNESKPYDGDKATNRRSIYGPFSGELRSSSIHRRASTESVRTLRSIDKRDRTIHPAADTAVNSASQSERTGALKESEDGQSPRSPTFSTPLLEPLFAVIPQTNVLREEPQQLARLRFDMDNIIDDFSFIHKTVLAWDGGAKIKRERHEHERQMRISDNERRVEDLFDDNVIGYADISSLEAEFKQRESVKKAEEEREEVESFVASVFDVVWARINYEMDQLTPLYQEATKLVADASAGKQMFEDTEERVPIAPIMEVLLVLYQKLMIRHQKAFEAVLERDRRLKKTEVSPWFAIGQIDKVKLIEKRFEDAEKKAILEFCRQRDERANLLMDVLDQHTLRGVGANQDYMESVMQAVRKIAIHVVKADPTRVDNSSADEVVKAKFITIALSRSSEQIVRTFHIADMLLNAADYEVSVANAKLSNADTAAFRRLKEAKAKEDAKLAADLEHRIGLIKGDTQRTQEEVAKLMTLLGYEDADLAFDITRERDKRLVAALNEKTAKQKRTASGPQHLRPPVV